MSRTLTAVAMSAGLIAGAAGAVTFAAHADDAPARTVPAVHAARPAQSAQSAQSGSRATAEDLVTMDSLLQPRDYSQALGSTDRITSTTGVDEGRYAMTMCSGETALADLVGRDADRYYNVLSGRVGNVGHRVVINEHVAQSGTIDGATAAYRKAAATVRLCQPGNDGHWYYGPTHKSAVNGGTATWAASYNGDGAREGGLAVVRVGPRVAVTEVIGAVTPQQLSDLARATAGRMG